MDWPGVAQVNGSGVLQLDPCSNAFSPLVVIILKGSGSLFFLLKKLDKYVLARGHLIYELMLEI